MIPFPAEPLDQCVTALPILPRRVLLLVKEQRAVPGIFRINVDLSRENSGAHDVRGPELQLVFHGNAVRLEQRQDHVPEQGAFGVDLGCHDYSVVARSR